MGELSIPKQRREKINSEIFLRKLPETKIR